MKKLIPWTIFLFFLTLSTNSFPQWLPANGNLREGQLMPSHALDAVDSNCAAITIGSGIFITIDGGSNWENISPPNFTWGSGWDISMIDSLHLWFGSGDGKILATSDGGKNWATQFEDTSKTTFMNYIKMFDLLNGIAMGDGKTGSNIPLFVKTTDGGTNWISVNDSAFGAWSGDTWRRLDFITPNAGYFYESGLNPQTIYKTSDGCKTWKKVQTPSSVHVLNFYDDNLGLSYGLNAKMGKGSIYRTTDGGNSWEEIAFHPETSWGNDIEFLKNDPSKVWLTNYNSLYFSSDSGKTWAQQVVPAPQPIPDYISPLKARDLAFTDNAVGWLLCDSMVYRNIQSDHIYTIVNIGTENFIPIEFSLAQNYPNPFNPSTTIEFTIEKQGPVLLQIYNSLGQEVTTLIDKQLSAGQHKVNFDAGTNSISSGIYYYILHAGNLTQTKGMIYLK